MPRSAITVIKKKLEKRGKKFIRFNIITTQILPNAKHTLGRRLMYKWEVFCYKQQYTNFNMKFNTTI